MWHLLCSTRLDPPSARICSASVHLAVLARVGRRRCRCTQYSFQKLHLQPREGTHGTKGRKPIFPNISEIDTYRLIVSQGGTAGLARRRVGSRGNGRVNETSIARLQGHESGTNKCMSTWHRTSTHHESITLSTRECWC